MSFNEILLIAIILATFVLITSNRFPKELIALGVLLVLSISHLISVEHALSGFSSSVVITLIGLFGITGALETTGVIHWIAEKLNSLGGGSELKLITLFMVTGAMLSLIMNNIAAGAVLLPAAIRVARIANVRVSKLLIPLSFGTLVGGMSTYLTTANIVMSELLLNRGLPHLGMLDFLPTGGVISICGVIFMLLIGRRLLPDRESITQSFMPPNLQETYHLDERMWELRVLRSSRLANTKVCDSGIGEKFGLTLMAIWHRQQTILPPDPDHRIQAGDVLLLVGRKERIDALRAWGHAIQDETGMNSHRPHVDLIEVIVAPRSNAVGQTLTQLKFRSQYGPTVIAIWREGRSYRTDVGTMPLQVGDALLVVGSGEEIQNLAQDRSYIVPASGYSTLSDRSNKVLLAVLITAVVLILGIFEILPLPLVMLAGASAMIFTGCLKMQEFYDFVEWEVIFLIVGILPLSIATAETGLATRIGAGLVNALTGQNPLLLIACMFLLTVAVTQVIGGQVTALLVGPISITAALQMNVNPQAMAVAVAIGCSTAFLTPIAHPVNILMMGPAGYRFDDFFRVGIGMTVITLVALLFGMVVFWGIG